MVVMPRGPLGNHPGIHVGAGGSHTQGVENSHLEKAFPVHAADLFDDGAEQHISRVAVGPARAWLELQWLVLESVDDLLQRMGHAPDAVIVWQAAVVDNA